MLNPLHLDTHNEWMDKDQPIFPSLTAAFIEGLHSCAGRRRRSREAKQLMAASHSAVKVVCLTGVADPTRSSCRPGNSRVGDTPVGCESPLDHEQVRSQELVVRKLVEAISRTFNNVLMAIWGNATLIRLKIESDDPIVAHLLRMEKVIESGAFLIHMVLGYLGERRISAQRVRLEQIIQEIQKQGGKGCIYDQAHDLRDRLQWAATVQQPQVIAGSTAKVMDILFRDLNVQRIEVGKFLPADLDILQKLDRMDALILKGYNLVHHLLIFSGEIKPVKGHVDLKSVLTDALRHSVDRYADLNPVLKLLPDPCDMYMDRVLVSAALRRLISYAVHEHYRPIRSGAFPSGLSSINITPGTDVPRSHLVVSINFGAVTSPHAAATRPFEPFGPDHEDGMGPGIELAAACEVIKAHGGFILEIKADQGSTFQIMLPINFQKSARRSSPDSSQGRRRARV